MASKLPREYDCNSPADQTTIAGLHQISESALNNYISNFFGSGASNIQPTVKQWNELQEAMTGQDCTQMRWKLEMDHSLTSNNEISLIIEPIPDEETIVNYSIALFKGVKEAHNTATAFHFYKGKHDNGDFDIVFKAVNNFGETVYCGDLSNLHP
jgi:hypothetical protein